MNFIEILHSIDYFDLFSNTLMITSFVVIMMSLIEYVNVWSNGKFIKGLNKNIFVQALVGTFLGVIPGCMGTFTAVSLYTHKALSLGALVACLIATSGDESFVMLATMPVQSLWLFGICSVVAFGTSLLVDKLFKNKDFTPKIDDVPFDVHEDEECGDHKLFAWRNFVPSKARLKLIGVFAGIIFLCCIGVIGHSHSENLIFSLPQQETVVAQKVGKEHHECCEHHHHDDECCDEHSHEHHHDCDEHGHHHHDSNLPEGFEHHHEHGAFGVVNIIIISLSVLMLLIIFFSNEHFISEHLVHHVIQKHLPRIFWWTFGVLVLMAIILNYTNLGTWIYDNPYILLLIAVLVGVLPESGPHLIFVVLFVQGYMPFSILLANSIVQDGHGSLPLLAETKKGFLVTKAINMVVGLVVGLVGLLIGF